MARPPGGERCGSCPRPRRPNDHDGSGPGRGSLALGAPAIPFHRPRWRPPRRAADAPVALAAASSIALVLACGPPDPPGAIECIGDPPAVTARFARPERVERELLDATLEPGRTGVFDLVTPAGGALFILRASCGVGLTPWELLSPSGEPLFAGVGDSDPPPGETTNPIDTGARPLTVWIPNGAFDASAGGTYRLSLRASHRSRIEMTRVVPDGDAGQLHLAIHYVGGRGYEPTGERGPPEIERALDELDLLFAPAGISVGTVEQRRADDETLDRFAVVEGGVEGARQLFRSATGDGRAALHIFFVRSLDGGLLGFAGGVPGPAGLNGSEGSGVVIAADVVGGGAAMRRLLAHEIGHFLGLFHTTEPNGARVEALADTPFCGAEHDVDGNGLVDGTECQDLGADNLMFWAPQGTAITAQQRAVLARAPLLEPSLP